MAQKPGNKNRKYGRNKKKCERYSAMNKRAINKVRKLKRHMKRQPMDKQTAKVLTKLKESL